MQYRTLQKKLSEMKNKHGLEILVSLKSTKEVLTQEYLRLTDPKIALALEKAKREKVRREKFEQVKAKGLSDEQLVKDFLAGLGWMVEDSSKHDDMVNDIDCFVSPLAGELFGLPPGIPVSIKAQHKGLKFNNIGFEVEKQLTNSGKWLKSNWHTSKAEVYAILQGTVLRLYLVKDLKEYVNKFGFIRIRSLSPGSKTYQGGAYMFQDARCGYLNPNCVPHLRYEVSTTMASLVSSLPLTA